MITPMRDCISDAVLDLLVEVGLHEAGFVVKVPAGRFFTSGQAVQLISFSELGGAALTSCAGFPVPEGQIRQPLLSLK